MISSLKLILIKEKENLILVWSLYHQLHSLIVSNNWLKMADPYSTRRLLCQSVGLTVGWSFGRLLVGWSIGKLVCRSIGLLVCWSVGFLVSWYVRSVCVSIVSYVCLMVCYQGPCVLVAPKHPFQVPCSMFKVPSSMFPVPGNDPCSVFHGMFHFPWSMFHVPCSMFQVPSYRLQVPCSKLQVPCSKFQGIFYEMFLGMFYDMLLIQYYRFHGLFHVARIVQCWPRRLACAMRACVRHA